MERFAFEFAAPLSWPLSFVGVTPWTAHVDVGDDELFVRYGPWSLSTPLTNVEHAQVTGPYSTLKTIGPHVSLTDRGLTFGTTARRGVCITFREPVPAALPIGLLTHPAVTVTVAEADRLVSVLQRSSVQARSAGGRVGRIDGPARTTVRRRPSSPPSSRPSKISSVSPSPMADGENAGQSAAQNGAASGAASGAAPTRSAPARRRPPRKVSATPADMPERSEIRKLPGTDDPTEGLPPSDAEIAATASARPTAASPTAAPPTAASPTPAAKRAPAKQAPAKRAPAKRTPAKRAPAKPAAPRATTPRPSPSDGSGSPASPSDASAPEGSGSNASAAEGPPTS